MGENSDELQKNRQREQRRTSEESPKRTATNFRRIAEENSDELQKTRQREQRRTSEESPKSSATNFRRIASSKKREEGKIPNGPPQTSATPGMFFSNLF